jgi:3-oxoacyl-[acyl-carrier protein] reductase
VDLGLTGKVALVTGASRGIGHAIARALAAEGCRLAVNARNADSLRQAADALGSGTSFHPGDVSDAEQAAAVVRAALEAHQRLDIVVCNVGSGASVPPGQETVAEWRRVFDINLWASTNVIEACLPHLRAGASIVVISSICGREALGAPATYSAAKAALDAMARNLARPLGKRGIRVNVVAPGNVLFDGGVWDRKSREQPAEVAAMLERDVPLGRFGTSAEIADAVAFLASPRSGFVTGSTAVIDGGQTRS